MDPALALGLVLAVLLVVLILVAVLRKSTSTEERLSAPEAWTGDKAKAILEEEVALRCPHCKGTDIGVSDESQPLEKAIAKCCTCGQELGLFIELKTEIVPELRHFYKQVHGVSFKNDDGSSRQKILRKCSVGEVVELVPEPDNRYDSG